MNQRRCLVIGTLVSAFIAVWGCSEEKELICPQDPEAFIVGYII
jgi:hypothetical protein